MDVFEVNLFEHGEFPPFESCFLLDLLYGMGRGLSVDKSCFEVENSLKWRWTKGEWGGCEVMPCKIISAFVPGFGYKSFDSGGKRYLFKLCLACCTKLFCPLFRVPDIRVAKCSGEVLVTDATGLHSPSWLK